MVAAAVAAFVVALYRWPTFWVLSGIGEPDRPFLDLYGLLAARDAVRLGLDPYLPSALDPYHRPHVYSDWWLVLSNRGLGRQDTLWLGITLLAGTLAAGVAFVRPRSWREGLALSLLLVSPAFLLAVHRANNDLVVFLLVTAALWAWPKAGRLGGFVGGALFALATVLKYYPLTTLVLLTAERDRRRVLGGVLAFVAVVALAIPGTRAGLHSASVHLPVPTWLFAFGAPVVWRDFGLSAPTLWLVPGVIVLAGAAGAALVEVRRLPGGPAAVPDDAERAFVCGAAMLVGLFFLGASYLYKLIFALWLLPRIWRPGPGAPASRWLKATGWLLAGVAWFEGTAALLLNLLAPHLPDGAAAAALPTVLVIGQVLGWLFVAVLCRLLAADLLRWNRDWLPGLRAAPPVPAGS